MKVMYKTLRRMICLALCTMILLTCAVPCLAVENEPNEADSSTAREEDSRLTPSTTAQVSEYTVCFSWSDDLETVSTVTSDDPYVQELSFSDLTADELSALNQYAPGDTVTWYADPARTTPFDFSTEITGAVTLYAGILHAESLPSEEDEESTSEPEPSSDQPDAEDDGDSDGQQRITVTFVWEDGVTTTAEVLAGECAEELNWEAGAEAGLSLNAGYKVDWYTDADKTNLYDFTSPVVGDLTLYADCVPQEAEVTYIWSDEIQTASKVSAENPYAGAPTWDQLEEEQIAALQLEYDCDYYEVVWYSDSEKTEKFDFESTQITEPRTLYAGYNQIKYIVRFVWKEDEEDTGEYYTNTVEERRIVLAGECIEPLTYADAPDLIVQEFGFWRDVYWYTVGETEEKELYNFETPVTDNLTLYPEYPIWEDMKWYGEQPGLTEYTLTTVDELRSLTALTENGYDFEGVTITIAQSLSLGDEWTPIGSEEHPFAGTFDGNGYQLFIGKIQDTVTQREDFGVFGYVTGTLKNVTVAPDSAAASPRIYVNANYLGGLVGRTTGTVENCRNEVSVYNTAENGVVGGVVGSTTATVTDCENTAQLIYASKSNSTAGGIVGLLESGASVERCINGGEIRDIGKNGVAGGIAGRMEDGTWIQFCGNMGTITVRSTAGGIAGSLDGDGQIFSCFNSGNVPCAVSDWNGGAILGSSVPELSQVLALCCNLNAVSKSLWDAGHVAYTENPAEAAYLLDNGGSGERCSAWTWVEGAITPVLIEEGAAPLYHVKMVASGNNTLTLSSEYPAADSEVTITADHALGENERFAIRSADLIEDDYTIGEQTVTFLMPERDVFLSIAVVTEGEEYTVTFYRNADEANEVYGQPQQVQDNDPAVVPEANPEYKTEEGSYIFLGWFCAVDSIAEAGALGLTLEDEPYNFDALVTGDLNLYAKWGTVTVKYDVNASGFTYTGTPADVENVLVGATLTEPEKPIAQNTGTDNWQLIGWSTQPDGDEDSLWVFETGEADSEDADAEESGDGEAAEPTEVPGDAEHMTLTLYGVWVNMTPVRYWAMMYGVEGKGTEESPYLIAEDEQLNTLADVMKQNETLEGVYFRLDATGKCGGQFTLTNPMPVTEQYEYTYPPYYPDEELAGTTVTIYVDIEFQGNFDGNREAGCTVDVSGANSGLFGTVGENGVVKNLAVTGSMTPTSCAKYAFYGGGMGTAWCVGGVADVSFGTIENCASNVSIDPSALEKAGGNLILGTNSSSLITLGGVVGGVGGCGTVADCQTSGVEITGALAGGIAGILAGDAKVTVCTVTDAVLLGNEAAGGVVGAAGEQVDTGYDADPEYDGGDREISGCTVEGNGSVTGGGAGGVLGTGAWVRISGCSNSVPVASGGSRGSTYSGEVYIGGIVGSLKEGSLTDCRNSGSVFGESTVSAHRRQAYVGGIAGRVSENFQELRDCENSGSVAAAANEYADAVGGSSDVHVGGICGSMSVVAVDNLTNSGDITVTSTCDSTAGGIGGIFGETKVKLDSLSNCTQRGTINVTADGGSLENVGGLIGCCASTDANARTMTGCAVSGTVTASAASVGAVGGLIGSITGTTVLGVSNGYGYGTYLYLIGDTSIEGADLSGLRITIEAATSAECVGGLVGYADGLTAISQVGLTSTDVRIEAPKVEKVGGLVGSFRYAAGRLFKNHSGGDWDERINGEERGNLSISGVSLPSTLTVSTDSDCAYIGAITGSLENTGDIELGSGYGNFSVMVSSGGSAQYIGGLVGAISDVDSLSCVDFSGVSVTVESQSDCAYIGALAGAVSGPEELNYSGIRNITVNVTSGGACQYIGGLAGKITVPKTLACGVLSGITVTVSGAGENGYIGGVAGKITVESAENEKSGAASGLTKTGVEGLQMTVSGGGTAIGGLTGSGDIADCYVVAESFSAEAGAGLLTGDGSVSASYFYGPDTGLTVAGNGGAVTGGYCLGDTAGGESKTAEQFRSGEVAWLMETMDGTSLTEHRQVWTQGDSRPVWGEGTLYRVRAVHPENGSILVNGVGTAQTADDAGTGEETAVTLYVPGGETVEVEVIPFESVETAEMTVTYELLSVSATAEATGETQSWTNPVYSFSAAFDSLVSAEIQETEEPVIPEPEIPEPVGDAEPGALEEGTGGIGQNGGGGNGVFNPGGSGNVGGADNVSSGSVLPSADGEYDDSSFMYADASDTIRAEQSSDEPSSSGGETVSTEPAPMSEPEIEAEVEPEPVAQPQVFKLVPSLATVIKENPLLTALVCAGVVALCVLGALARYKNYKNRF